MEFAFRSGLYLCILYSLNGHAYNACKVPNAGAGTCISISKCTPLQILYKKQHKNRLENLFIQQSLCGNSDSPALKVCCPSEEDWSNFKPRPVMFPGPDNVYTPRSTEVTPTKETSKPVVASTESFTFNTGLGTRILGTNKKSDCGVDSASSNKITGGNATGIDQYPWLVLLEYQSTTEENIDGCGGALINTRFVLTAGHCVPGSLGMPKIVRLAEYDKTTTPTDEVEADGGGVDTITEKRIEVETAIRHPLYSRNDDVRNDIGIVKMVSDIVFDDFIKAICLPTVNFVPTFGKETLFTVAGWGTDNGVNILVKSEVKLPYVSLDTCQGTQDHEITKTQICAGGEKGKDSCKGDSGGPLMYEYKGLFYAVGVVSYGKIICGLEGSPAVYTNVYEYIPWIESVITKN